MSNHTPGPWFVDRKHTLAVMAPDGNEYPWHVANVMHDCGGDDSQADSNVRLIASAPELLAALQRAVPWLGKLIADGGHMNSVAPNDAVGALQQAEAAIAKALK